jgi:hypothetical protein
MGLKSSGCGATGADHVSQRPVNAAMAVYIAAKRTAVIMAISKRVYYPASYSVDAERK